MFSWMHTRRTRNMAAMPNGVTQAWVSLPINEVHQLVGNYVTAIETQKTDDWCKCTWLIHPDDTEKPKGKRRKMLKEVNLECPVHTKEGFLLGFVKYVSDNGH